MSSAAGPSRPPTTIEEFLWNIHSVLADASGPVTIDNIKEVYSQHQGHKFAIERFLVVGDGGLQATLKRIPHIVKVVQANGTVSVQAALSKRSSKEDLIAADQNYRKELQAKAKAKAKAGAPAKAAAPADNAAAPKRPPPASPEAPTADGKKARPDDADTLARMLVQGVARVLQNRAKAGKGALPVNDLEEEFKALWKVPFNLQSAGETDTETFLRKWPSKLEVLTEGGVLSVQLSKKALEKQKAEAPAATAPKATPAAPAKAAAAAPKAAPTAAAGPSKPPAVIEDFLFHLTTVLQTNGPVSVDDLKDVYAQHHGHKFAIERFLVVGEGGLAATLRRIPHIVTTYQTGPTAMVKSALAPGATKDSLVDADKKYRVELKTKAAAAKAAQAHPKAAEGAGAGNAGAAAAAPAPVATAAKAGVARPAAAPPEGEKDAKKPRTAEESETLSRMLVQGIVRVLQNRQKDGKGALPVDDLEEEFKTLWKVPFNLQQAGETDAVQFLQKWPNKVEVLQEGGRWMCQVAKKPTEKAKAGPPATAAKAAAAAPAADSGVAAAEVPAAKAVAPKASSTANGVATIPVLSGNVNAEASLMNAAKSALSKPASTSSLPEIRRQASDMLQAMKDMMKQQEALVSALEQYKGKEAP